MGGRKRDAPGADTPAADAVDGSKPPAVDGSQPAGARADERDVVAVAALADPTRRALYRVVADATAPVSRDAAAAAAGVSRSLAAFHLDRLAQDGLLTVEFRRLGARSGPGAGRPAKLYRRVERDVRVSLPPRNYELAARILAATLDAADPTAAERARLADVARRVGSALAADAPAGGASVVPDLLRRLGYEPVSGDGGELFLRNCPFHALAREHLQLVCGMNHDVLAGLTDAAGGGWDARLEPAPGRCCVVLAPRAAAR